MYSICIAYDTNEETSYFDLIAFLGTLIEKHFHSLSIILKEVDDSSIKAAVFKKLLNSLIEYENKL